MLSDQGIYRLSDMHVEQRGSGPKVVLVHGGEEEGGLGAFAAQLPLAESYTLIIPDLPGHGQSPAHGQATTPARDALLVAVLLADVPIWSATHMAVRWRCGLRRTGQRRCAR